MVKLIAHVLVHSGDDYLLVQRSEIKRGQPNVYPTYWDIPGGGVLPIPPLDGGRFVVEVFQKGTRKMVSQKAMNYMSLAGMALFLGFFVIMLNQDIQRFVFGNWG